jgi:4-hydroxybutyrate CoA-transferase
MNWKERAVSADDALRHVKSGMKAFIHGAAATPTPLIEAMCRRRDVENVTLFHLHLEGSCAFADAEHQGRFHSVSLFTGPSLRKPVEEGRADFMPIFLSDIPKLFASRRLPLDVAIVQLSPPDKHGFCTLGTSCDAARSAVDGAQVIIAEVNERMPRTHGNTFIHLDRVEAFIATDRPLPHGHVVEIGPVEAQIGEQIAALIEDGSTLQMGIGAIPDAVLARLGNKRDLGVHTEMFSDGLVPLLENGVVNNRFKKVHRGRTTTSFVNGTEKVFKHVDDNPSVEFHPCDRTNDTALIRDNPKVVAINSALELDLSGQVCADSIGYRVYSGIGGQMDFIHGAALSVGGKPIIAIPSTAANGKLSRIVPSLKPGAGVVTTRGHVHWVVTEYGAANLHGMTLRERADALIGLAHPDFRAELRKEIAAIRHFAL